MDHDRAASFRSRLRAGELITGSFLKTPSAIVCEVLGLSELGVVCLDAEHAPFDRLSLDGCVAALRAAGMPSLVRVPSSSPEHILNALDCGATGIVAPHVRTADDARAVVRSAHYGSGGERFAARGYAGSSRAARYGGVPLGDHVEASANRTTVIVQIEDVEALPHVAAIAAVPGVDAVFLGRADLTVSLGQTSPFALSVLDACKAATDAARGAGCAVGTFTPDLAETPMWRGLGVSLFLLASDHAFLLDGARTLVQAVEGSVTDGPAHRP
jgi:2-keto-3-deoxy-L-rhamnonate aldolase RhmA